VAVALLGVGIVARFLVLDADPRYEAWGGYILDEGRWTEQARNMVLFGETDLEMQTSRWHLLLAPLFQAAAATSFLVLGVGFVSARLVTVASACVLLAAVYFLLRGRVSDHGLAAAMLVVAFQPDLFVLSRVAIPEVPALLFEFLAFAILLAKPRSVVRALIAGLVAAVGLGFKGTVAPIVPVLMVVIWVLPSERENRLARSLTFVGVIAYLAAVAVVGSVVLSGGSVGATVESMVGRFLAPGGAYGAATVLFYGEFAPSLHALLVVNLAIGLLLMAARSLPEEGRDLYLASLAWAGGWVLVALVMRYFPARYQVQVVVPLAVNLAAGLTLLGRLGPDRIMEGLRRLGPASRALFGLALGLPLAALLASPLVSLADVLGFSTERLREHVMLIVAADVAMAAAVLAYWRDRTVAVLVTLPLLALVARGIPTALGAPWPGHWEAGGAGGLVRWSIVLATAGTAALWLAARRGFWGSLRTAGAAYAVGLAVVWTAVIGPPLVAPTYTIRDASRGIGDLVPDGATVSTDGGSSLFLGNELRYRERLDQGYYPDMLVLAFDPGEPFPGVMDRYEAVRYFAIDYGEGFIFRDVRRVGATLHRRID
jgi:hypothetical protein